MAAGLNPQTDVLTASTAPSQIEVSISQTASSTTAQVAQSASDATNSTSTKPKNVGNLVKEYFKDIPVMQDIAYCESRNRQFNPDGTVFRGKVNHNDVGVMQINTDYHLDRSKDLGMDIFTTEGNMEYARQLFEKEGTTPWDSSSKCWSSRSNHVAMK